MKKQDTGAGTSRRRFLAGATAAGASVALGAAPKLAAQDDNAGARPNLVYVFADQLGYRHLGYAGCREARTPNIDTLASQGTSFANALSTMPVCAAHRASLFTGKYPTTTGMAINELRVNPNHECFGHALTKAGYQTGYVGKWHLWANQLGHHHDPRNSHIPPGPHRLGFDGYWAAYNFHHHYYDAYYHTDSTDQIPYDREDNGKTYEPDAQTDLAINFLRRTARRKQPFALFLSYGTPHDPWTWDNVPEDAGALFRNTALPNPPNYLPRNDSYADGWGRFKPGERRQLEQWRRIYCAMNANLDRNVGRLLAAIAELNAADNTVVVFTSDHGEMFGAHGRRAKNIFYEEACRVPFLVRWPGKTPKGHVSDACLGTVDIMPTVLSLMGLPVPKDVEGMDLSRCATGQAGAEPEAALMQNLGACAAWQDGYEWRALRDKRYTYAIYRKDRRELLFDNVADPYQMKDLAADAAHKDTMERFRRALQERMAELNDTFEKCTWYRENWTRDRIILRGAKG